MVLEERLGRSALWEARTASSRLIPWKSSAFRPRRTHRNLDALLVDKFLLSLALAPIIFTAPCSTISGMTSWMQTTGSIHQLLHHFLKQKSGKMILVERWAVRFSRIERFSSFPTRAYVFGCRKP